MADFSLYPRRIPPASAGRHGFTPTDAQCFASWDACGMLDNIREHSLMVSGLAMFLARLAKDKGLEVDLPCVRAASLLHDIAKTYTIRHGGHHAQLGGAWTMEYTGNPRLAQGVAHHIYWPFEMDLRAHLLPLVIIYADKRVMHDRVVGLGERFTDLIDRYGSTELIRERIKVSNQQAKDIERSLSQILGFALDAYPFDSRRLVE